MRRPSEERGLVEGYLKALSGLVILQGLAITLGAVMARVFPTIEAFGRFNLVHQVLGMAGLLLGMGIDTALVVHLSRERRGEGAKRRFNTAFRFSVWHGLALVLALAIMAPWIARWYGAPALAGDLQVATAGLLGASILLVAQAALTGWGQFGRQATTTVVYQIALAGAMVAGAVAAGALGQPQAATKAAFGAAGVAGLAVAVWSLLWAARDGGFALSLRGGWTDLRPMAAYGVPYWVGNFFKAYQQSFILMLTGFVSLAEVGYLSNAWRLSGLAGIVTWGFMIVTLPFISEPDDLATQHDRTRMANRYNLYVLLPVCAGLILYAADFTTLVFGEQYAPSARHLPVMTIGVLLSALGRLGSQCLAAVGRTRDTAVILTLPGLIVLAGGPVLIPWNVDAAPWLYLTAWLTSATAALWLMARHGLGLSLREDFGRPLIATGLLVAGMVAGRTLGAAWHPLLALGGLAAGAALVYRWEAGKRPALRSATSAPR